MMLEDVKMKYMRELLQSGMKNQAMTPTAIVTSPSVRNSLKFLVSISLTQRKTDDIPLPARQASGGDPVEAKSKKCTNDAAKEPQQGDK